MSQPFPSASDRGSGAYLAMICGVASLGGLLFGFDTAVISGTVEMVQEQFELTDALKGWFTSSALIGCILGALIAGWSGDRLGRKPCLIFAALLFFISALGSAIPPNFSVLIPARWIGGVGVGMASVLGPIYITEFCPPKIRGRLVALYQLSIVIGILAAYFSNWSLQLFATNFPETFGGAGFLHWTLVAEVWRGMFGAEMIPAALFFFLLFLVPESPRWLIKAGRTDEGFAILRRIAGTATAQQELDEIRQGLAQERGSFAELFEPGFRKALLVGVGLSFFGQLTGVNVIVYYGPTILKEAGFAFDNALGFQVLLGVINLVFTVAAILTIDSLGRRPLLVGGMGMVTLMLLGTAFLFATGVKGIPIVILLGLYIAFLAFSICGVIWVLTPEIFPNRIRGQGASISTFTNWSMNAAAAGIFPWYVAQYGMGAGFFTFAAICLVATAFFFLLVPETKGRSLEEIERFWKEGKF